MNIARMLLTKNKPITYELEGCRCLKIVGEIHVYLNSGGCNFAGTVNSTDKTILREVLLV